MARSILCPARSARALLFSAALLAAAAAPARAAITTPDGLSLRTLEEYRATGVPADQWPALLEAFGRVDQNAAVRSLVKELKPFPAAQLVALLTHPKLAIRSGALDLLEEAAGDSFNFDPFLEDPSAGANLEALQRWKAWSTGTTEAVNKQPLTADQFRTLALEIMSGNRERAERAMQRLDRFGFNAIGQIEAFLASQAALEPAARAALKAAEYRIVILQALPKQGSALARDLCLGNAEAQSLALATLGKAGVGVLPVITEFFTAPDPLVRETAVDAAFQAGAKNASPLVAARLSQETAESVLHAMLRGLGANITDPKQVAAIEGFIKHPAENVVISAIEALGVSGSGNVGPSLTAALQDPRWRVRATALEAIGKRKLAALSDQVKKALNDPDLFVRASAVETLQRLTERVSSRDPEAKAQDLTLLKEFKLQNDLKATILRSFLANDNKAPLELFQQLLSAPPEVILQCLETLEDRGDHSGERAVYAAFFARHPNPDVAASALRILAAHGRYTGLLLAALQSGDRIKVDAVLDVLVLPPNATGRSTAGASSAAPKKSNGILDSIYNLFSRSSKTDSGAEAEADPAAEKAVASGGKGIQLPADKPAAPEQLRAVLERFFKEGSPRQRFRAALTLASQGHAEAMQFLLDSYDTLNELDRRMLSNPLMAQENWASGPSLELARRLLNDPTDDVRESATELWLKPQHLAGLLAELAKPGSLLQPADLLDYQLERFVALAPAREPILKWATALFANPEARDSHKVFAIVLLAKSGQKKLIEPFLTSSSPWLRRAAFRALGLGTVQSHLATLLKDDSAWVRAVIPFVAAPHNSGWLHWFDDVHSAEDQEDFENDSRSYSGQEWGAWAQKTDRKGKVTPEIVAALEKLSGDPSEMVRFEAQFALLRLKNPIDPAGFGALLAAQSAESNARRRVGAFLSKNYQRLDRSYGVLLPLSTGIYEHDLPKILKHFAIDTDNAFTSFSALAKLSAVAPENPPPPPAAADPAATAPASQQGFRVVFFHKVGCRDCQRVREMLNRHAPDFPNMIVEEHDISDPKDALLSEALSQRFELKDNLHLATPALFTQAGPLVREEISFAKLGDLLRRNRSETPDPNWARVETKEIVTAQEVVTQRYETLSFGVIAMAGLLDGINPCAFATLIFLLSYLQVSRRTPREILAIGGAFILAVFLTYFAVGLGLAQVLTKITGFQAAGKILNQVLAAFALVVAVLSFRDARLAARGQIADMSIQLPALLKTQIHSVIRQGTRATRFVLAAFGVGVAISLLELACTGQVYLPTILYMLHSGNNSAVAHLLLYNLAFILPLVTVFGLAWGGMRTDALVRFQTERTALVKTLTGLLFLLLTAFLLFGHLLR